MADEEQKNLWMYMIFNKDKIKERTEQLTKEAEEAGMTLTEYLESISPLAFEKYPCNDPIDIMKMCEHSTKALEDYAIKSSLTESKEYYEDCISRQAALEIIKNLYPDIPIIDFMEARRKKYAPYIECENVIEQLPPVTPKQKMGQWIKHDIEYSTGHRVYYDCSLCGCAAPCTETADKILWKMAKYCPDCGAKMKNGSGRYIIDQQESEVSE